MCRHARENCPLFVKQEETEFSEEALEKAEKILEDTKMLKFQMPYIDKIIWPYKDRRWLFPIFKSFIKIIAKIHYKQRKYEADAIVSTPEDFEIAKELWKNFDKILIYRVSDPARDLLEKLARAYCHRLIHDGELRTNDPTTHKPVHMHCYRQMKKGKKKGFS